MKPMDCEKLRAESSAGDDQGLVVRTVGVQVSFRLCNNPTLPANEC